MSTKRVSLAEANGHLVEPIVAAKRSDEVVIEDEENNRVKLVTLPRVHKPRVLGLHSGQVQMREDLNAPLSESYRLGGNQLVTLSRAKGQAACHPERSEGSSRPRNSFSWPCSQFPFMAALL